MQYLLSEGEYENYKSKLKEQRSLELEIAKLREEISRLTEIESKYNKTVETIRKCIRVSYSSKFETLLSGGKSRKNYLKSITLRREYINELIAGCKDVTDAISASDDDILEKIKEAPITYTIKLE